MYCVQKVDTMDKSVDTKPSSGPRPPPAARSQSVSKILKNKKKSDKKVELDDLKREVEMVSKS